MLFHTYSDMLKNEINPHVQNIVNGNGTSTELRKDRGKYQSSRVISIHMLYIPEQRRTKSLPIVYLF